MKITSLELINFKRFSKLRIENIPTDTQLVLLIGSNGSGKSCVFDAFDWLQKGLSKGMPYQQDESLQYYRKQQQQPAEAIIQLAGQGAVHKQDWQVLAGKELTEKFIGRSSIRIVPRITSAINPHAALTDADSPRTFIEQDERFLNDVFLYIQSINNALREPVFSGRQADTLQIFQQFIQPFNDSLAAIFGDNPQTAIRIAEFEDATPNKPAKLIFKKGNTKINYDLLSHGEKQIIILLLNFIVRRKAYEDAIIFIDEMDVHLNTKLQYSVLKEITERWIPEGSQLWTASHALGFIDFANDYDKGVVLDFDDLDFDQPQIISPAAKNDFQVFELAVSKDFIGKVLEDRTIYFAENTDTPIYNSLNFDNTLFFNGKDKIGAFTQAQHLRMNALVDRDYLTDEEVEELRRTYPFLYVLPYYSIENLMYHPDNMEEYYAKQGRNFDKENYIKALTKEKQDKQLYIAGGIAKARDSYPFFKDAALEKQRKKFINNYPSVIDMLASDDFETFYKVFPAKDYGTQLPERQNIPKDQLTKTQWFRRQVAQAIERQQLND